MLFLFLELGLKSVPGCCIQYYSKFFSKLAKMLQKLEYFNLLLVGRFIKSIIDLHVVINVLAYFLLGTICDMQYNGQNNNEFRCRWNNCNDNNLTILRGEDHKQAGFQRTGSSSFISDTKILRIDKMSTFDPTRREDFCADTL